MTATLETTDDNPEGQLEVLLRPMRREDINLVTNSWMKNARKCYAYKGVPSSVYDKQHHRVIARLIPKTVMVIACDPAAPDRIYGWTCAEIIDNFLILHYVWVRSGLKRLYNHEEGERGKSMGVGNAMLQKLLEQPHLKGLVYTHETQSGKYWLQHLRDTDRLPFDPIYNPYQLYASFHGHQ